MAGRLDIIFLAWVCAEVAVELSRPYILKDQDAQTLAASGPVVSRSSAGSPGGPSMKVDVSIPIGAKTGSSWPRGALVFAPVGASQCSLASITESRPMYHTPGWGISVGMQRA
jgi:hypothetical protein